MIMIIELNGVDSIKANSKRGVWGLQRSIPPRLLALGTRGVALS